MYFQRNIPKAINRIIIFSYVAVNTLLFPLGIIPALLILYIVVGKYEGKFIEKNIFLLFIGGLIFGSIIYLIERLAYLSIIHIIYNLLLFSFLFSLIEQLAKFVVLNMRALYDDGVPIYGASLGLGFSSLFSSFFIMSDIEINFESIFLVILIFSAILINCSTGIFLGIGIKRAEKLKYFFIAIFVGIVMWILLILSGLGYESLIISSLLFLFFSLSVFLFLIMKHLPLNMLSRRELKKVGVI